MVNPLKLKEMISLAAFEEGEGRQDLAICRYYQSDYVALRLIRTFFLTALADILIIGLAAAGDLDYLAAHLADMDLMSLAAGILWFILATEIGFLAITWWISRARYRRAAANVRAFEQRIRILEVFEDMEGAHRKDGENASGRTEKRGDSGEDSTE